MTAQRDTIFQAWSWVFCQYGGLSKIKSPFILSRAVKSLLETIRAA